MEDSDIARHVHERKSRRQLQAEQEGSGADQTETTSSAAERDNRTDDNEDTAAVTAAEAPADMEFPDTSLSLNFSRGTSVVSSATPTVAGLQLSNDEELAEAAAKLGLVPAGGSSQASGPSAGSGKGHLSAKQRREAKKKNQGRQPAAGATETESRSSRVADDGDDDDDDVDELAEPAAPRSTGQGSARAEDMESDDDDEPAAAAAGKKSGGTDRALKTADKKGGDGNQVNSLVVEGRSIGWAEERQAVAVMFACC